MMDDAYIHTFAAMGTVVTVRVPGRADAPARRREREELVRRAAGWFRTVEEVCNRFDPASELSRLSATIGRAVPLSPLLYRTLEFALALAHETEGAFDPTVGRRMEIRGFDSSYRTGESVRSAVPMTEPASYRDAYLDANAQTLTLARPLLLDLGALAKGLGVDLAARELAPLGRFAIDAGGDVYAGGEMAPGEPWLVGIQHPRDPKRTIRTIQLSDLAVCTSGDYERKGKDGADHIMDPRGADSQLDVVSVSVIAPSAMVADGLSTAAMVLGADGGFALLERQEVDGLIVNRNLDVLATEGFERYAVLPPKAARPA